MVAALQGFQRAVDRWGGRGGRGGAPGRIGEARGGRWPWVRRAALSGAFGDERVGEQRRGRGSREREAVEGVEASPWRREGVGEAATAKQEVEASACARACVLLRLCLLAEVEDSRSAPVGWTGAAGPATGKWPR